MTIKISVLEEIKIEIYFIIWNLINRTSITLHLYDNIQVSRISKLFTVL